MNENKIVTEIVILVVANQKVIMYYGPFVVKIMYTYILNKGLNLL